MKRFLKYFSPFEWALWALSLALILTSFLIFDRTNYLILIGSLLGATSLSFVSKGNPIGEIINIVFSIFYGAISYSYAYYGEMITYLGMTLPMSVITLIAWARHPFRGKKSEVEIKKVTVKETIFALFLSLVVSVVFYFILKALNTANLIISTISVFTSFIACYMTFRRSPYYAIGYAANDIVLVIMWVMASFDNRAYVSMAVCFATFFLNDCYGFFNWLRMQGKQKQIAAKEEKSGEDPLEDEEVI